MKHVDGMVLIESGNEWIVIPTEDAPARVHGKIRLNKTGKIVWDCLTEGLSEPRIAEQLSLRLGVDEMTAELTVASVLDRFESLCLIEA